MKLSKTCKIEAIASTEQARISITEPYLKGDRLIATNGKALVVLPVEREEGDVDGYVTADALAAARKVGHKTELAQIKCNGLYALANGATMPRDTMLEGCNFPNIEQVIPTNTEGRKIIALNAKLLADIAKALDADNLRLEIAGENEAVIVRGSRADSKAFAVLMPVRCTQPTNPHEPPSLPNPQGH